MDPGLSVASSLEEGWTVVRRRRRRKEKIDVQKEEKTKEGKGTKKELCKVKNSGLFCRAPSLRTWKKTPLLKCPNSEVPSSFVGPVQDPGIRDALFQEECRHDCDFLNQVLALERMLRVKARTESASLSALSVPVVSPARSLGVFQRAHSRRADTAHAIAGESKELTGLLEVLESVFFSWKAGAAVVSMWLHVHVSLRCLVFLRLLLHLLLLLRLLLLLHMRAPHPCMLHPREGGVPKVGFPVRPKICALSQRWRQGSIFGLRAVYGGRLQVHYPGG